MESSDNQSEMVKPGVRMSREVKGVAGLVLIVGAVIGGLYGASPAPTRPSDEMANEPVVRDFAKALQLIDEHSVITPDKPRLTRGALLEMLHMLDPHSNFFDRRDFSEMQDEQSSKFYGIGVTINQRNGRIYVIGVSKGMPAERAGLQYGDGFVAVDGHSAKDWTQSDALKYVRGERGTKVEITVERVGSTKPLVFRIERDEVPFPSVRNFFMIRPETGYIGLNGGFNQETTEEVHAAIAQLKEQGMTSLILDLRRNPGGLLKQAIQVAETFLPRGVEIVSVRGRAGRSAKTVGQNYRSENDHPETMPLVVLINGETASASEIVAGAIKDLDRGWIVGEESFGKGLVQTVFRLRGGTGLTLTTAKYFTPSGLSIQRAYNGVGYYNYFYSRRHGSVGSRKRTGSSSQSSEPEASGVSAGRSGGSNVESKSGSNERSGHTLTGREVRGGGGIKPDTVVKAPQENIRLRDACFEFVRALVAGLTPELAQYKVKSTEHGYRLRGNEYQLNEQVMTALRDFLQTRPELQVSEAQVNQKSDYVRRRIRAELITAAYGIEVAEQFLIESDEQALLAIEEIPKAKRLSDHARNFAQKNERQ